MIQYKNTATMVQGYKKLFSTKFKLETYSRYFGLSSVTLIVKSRGLRVSRTLIMRKAKYIYGERCDASERDLFVASRGWLEKFMRRNGLSLRRRTTVAQHDPARVIGKLISYVLHVRRLTSKHKYLASNIIAMDETAVWADMVADIGTRSVSLKTTGHEKVRVSVCLSAKADGTKLKPMIVLVVQIENQKLSLKNLTVVVFVASSKNAWMNEELTLVWVEKILRKFSFGRRLLSWDSFECHMMNSVKEAVKTSNSDLVIVPGGCTSIFKPLTYVGTNLSKSSLVRNMITGWLKVCINTLRLVT